MKNKANILLAKQIEELKKRTQELIPELYAAFCSVLFTQYGWDADEIAELFGRTEAEWQKLVEADEVKNMIQWCEQLTDITLKGEPK